MAFVVLEYRKLTAWQRSMELATVLYRFANLLPAHEEYGLKSQIRRAAVSIPSNIAEGCSRETIPAAIHFLYISLGSLSEIETQIELSINLGYAQPNLELNNLVKDVRGLLFGLIKHLKAKNDDKESPYFTTL